MGKGTVTVNLSATTDSNYRAMGQGFKTFFTSVLGLTQTADTGQADWATAIKPVATGFGHYEIYRLNDSGQATRPLFIKVRYGVGNPATGASVQFDIGEGSDGAGNLTGATWLGLWLFTINSSTLNATVDITGNWNPVTGYFGFCTLNSSQGATPITFSAERLRNFDGTPSTRGFALCSIYGATAIFYRTLTAGALSSEPNPSLPLFWPGQYPGAASAGGTFISALTPLTGDGTHGPLERTLGFLGCGWSDFSPGATFDITRWDSQLHTYVCTNTFGAASMSGASQQNNCRNAIWWD